MGEFSNYFNRQMDHIMKFVGNDVARIKYYRKSRRRYQIIYWQSELSGVICCPAYTPNTYIISESSIPGKTRGVRM